jgi:hypothetical protein
MVSFDVLSAVVNNPRVLHLLSSLFQFIRPQIITERCSEFFQGVLEIFQFKNSSNFISIIVDAYIGIHENLTEFHIPEPTAL